MAWKKLLLEDDAYTHPTSNGNKHIPQDGEAGKFLGYSALGTASWQSPPSSSTWDVQDYQGTKQWTTSHQDAIRFISGSNVLVEFDTTNKYLTFSATNTDTKWSGGTAGLNATTGRTSLGLGTMATAATGDYAALAGATFTGNVQSVTSTIQGGATDASTRYFLSEGNYSDAFGFSLLYAGATNPTIDGIGFTATNNTFNIFRHNDSAAGAVVLTIARSTGNATFAGTINSGAITSTAGITGTTGTFTGLIKSTSTSEQIRAYYDANTFASFSSRSDDSVQIYGWDGSSYQDILLAVDGATTSAGKVGIGTLSPQRTLSVGSGDLQVFDSANDSNIFIGQGNTTASPTYEHSVKTDASGNFKIRRHHSTGTDVLIIATDNAVTFAGTVALNGLTNSSYDSNADDLVLGSTSASAGMTIVSGTANTGYINFADGTSGDAMYRGYIYYTHGSGSDGILGFVNRDSGSSKRMELLSDGTLKLHDGGATFAGNVILGTNPQSRTVNGILIREDSSQLNNQIIIEQDGSGDASIGFLTTGAQGWSLGIDNSDSDKFKIASNWGEASDGLGTNTALTIDTSKNATFSGMVGAGITPAYPIHGYAASGSTAVRAQIGSDYIDLYPHGDWNHIMGTANKFYFDKEIRVDSGYIGSYNEDLSLRTSGSTRMTISNTTGNVSISNDLTVTGTLNATVANAWYAGTSLSHGTTGWMFHAQNTNENDVHIYLAHGDGHGMHINAHDGDSSSYFQEFYSGVSSNTLKFYMNGIGEITTGVWKGTAIASAYLDADTAHLSGTQTFSGAKTFSALVNINHGLYIDSETTAGNASGDDSVLHVRKSNNNDWGIIIDSMYSASTDYGLQIKNEGSYAFYISNGAATFRIQGDGKIVVGQWEASSISTTYTDAKNQTRASLGIATTDDVTFDDIYSDNWFRNNNASTGLYNTATESHLYSTDQYRWRLYGGKAGTTVVYLNMHTVGNILRGSLYATDAGTIGLLNDGNDWIIQGLNNQSARIYGNLYLDQNHGHGIVGNYSSTKYQGVFAMGDSYKLLADGSGTGTLYGMCWTHSNIGGQSKSGLNHQMLIMQNGTTSFAAGTGIWTSGSTISEGQNFDIGTRTMGSTRLTILGIYTNRPSIHFRSGHPNNANTWTMGKIDCGDDSNYNGILGFYTSNSGYDGGIDSGMGLRLSINSVGAAVFTGTVTTTGKLTSSSTLVPMADVYMQAGSTLWLGASGGASTPGTVYISNTSSNVLKFYTGGSQRFIIDNSTSTFLNNVTVQSSNLTVGGNIYMADDTSIGISDSDERIEFDGSGDISVLGAKLGIGTTTPDDFLLHVYRGNAGSPTWETTSARNLALFETDNAEGFVYILSPTTATSAGFIMADSDHRSRGGIIYNHNTDKLTIRAKAGNQITIDGNNNNVGIGTASPLVHLDVYKVAGDYNGPTKIAAFFGDRTNSSSPSTFITGNTINFQYNTEAQTGGGINYRGYLGAVAQHRDFYIWDGKAAPIISVYGNNKQVSFAGAGTFAGTLSVGTTASYQPFTLIGNMYINAGSQITWANGNATITEGSYELKFDTYNGSALTRALTLAGDNTATFTGALNVSTTAGTNVAFIGSPSVGGFTFVTDSGSPYLHTISVGSSEQMQFRTNGTVALKLDTSQNATFADQVSIGGNGKLRLTNIDTNASWSGWYIKQDTSANLQILYGDNSSYKWLEIAYSTGAATFAGNVTCASLNVDGAVDFDLGGTSHLNFGSDTNGVHMHVGSNQFFRILGDGGSDEWIRFADGGNVGINKTSPTAKLHVFGNSDTEPTAFFDSSGGNGDGVLIKGHDAGNVLELSSSTHTGAGSIMAVSHTGAVTVGYTLQVGGATTLAALSATTGEFSTTLTTQGEYVHFGRADADTRIIFSSKSGNFSSGSSNAWHNLRGHGSGVILNAGTITDTIALEFAGNVKYYWDQDSFWPHNDNAENLGKSDKRWANLYVADMHLKNDRGDWTVIEEEEYLSLKNNKNGKTYKIAMEEV